MQALMVALDPPLLIALLGCHCLQTHNPLQPYPFSSAHDTYLTRFLSTGKVRWCCEEGASGTVRTTLQRCTAM